MKIITRFIVEKGDNTAISNMLRQDGVWHIDCGNIASSRIKSVTVLDTLTGSELEMSLLDLSQKELAENNIEFNIHSEFSEYKEVYWSKSQYETGYPCCLILLKDDNNYDVIFCKNNYAVYVESSSELKLYSYNGVNVHKVLQGELKISYFISNEFEYKSLFDDIYIEYIIGSGYGITYRSVAYDDDNTYPIYVKSFNNEPSYKDKFIELTAEDGYNHFIPIRINSDIIRELNGRLFNIISNNMISIGDELHILGLDQQDLILPNDYKKVYMYGIDNWRSIVFPAGIESIVWDYDYNGKSDETKSIYLPINAKSSLVKHLLKYCLESYYRAKFDIEINSDEIINKYKTAKEVVDFLGDYLYMQVKFY